MQNFIRINSYVLNIFCKMNSKKDIWRKLCFSTLFSKFRHIRARFLSARKLSVIKDHLKKRIKLFPVGPDFFLFSNPILTGLHSFKNKLYFYGVTLWSVRPVKIGFEKRKKSGLTGNSFILFFKWSFITLNFRALKNLARMCRNFEKRVDKISFLQIFSLKLIL